MPDRPYTLLSCSMSIDGYLGSARRSACCSPTTPTSTGSTPCAPPATRSWSARTTVRTDNPRLLVRSQTSPRRAHGARARAVADQGHRDRARRARRARRLLHHRRRREARLLREPARGRRPRAARAGGDRRRRRPAPSRCAGSARTSAAPRRAAADGRGRRQGAHAVPHRRPRRRAAARRRAVLRRRLAGAAVRAATAASPGTPTGARRSPTSARSATWCCCATRSRRASGPTERGDGCHCHRLRDDPHRGVGAAAVRGRVRGDAPGSSASTGSSTAGSTSPSASASAPPRADPPGARPRAARAAAQRVPHRATSSAASAATAARSCARRSSGSPAAGGFLLYLRQEGRGIGLYAKLDAYALQDAGLDTYEANLALGHGEDERNYLVAAQMLRALGVSRVALLSNNPDKARQLRRFGVTVSERVPTGVHLSAANAPLPRDEGAPGRAHSLDVPLSSGDACRRPAATARTRRGSGCGRRPSARPAPAGRQQAVVPAPSGDPVEHLRVVGDDRDRHVVTRALAAHDLRGLMIAQHDEHELSSP